MRARSVTDVALGVNCYLAPTADRWVTNSRQWAAEGKSVTALKLDEALSKTNIY